MKGRLQFRHDNEVYSSFSEIEQLLHGAAQSGNLEVLIGEPYVFHYKEDGKLKTVLAIGDESENGLSRESRYALIDIDRVMDFVSKDGEIINEIESLGSRISELGVSSASIGAVSGEPVITLHREEGSAEDDIVIPLTEFRNEISDEISEAASEALLNAKDYADSVLASAETYTDEAVSAVSERVSAVESGKVDKEEGKTLSSNDYTDEEKEKLEAIENGAQANVIETVKVNGVAVEPDANKAVNIDIPFSSVSSEDKMLSLRNGVLSSIFNAEYDSRTEQIYFKGKDGIDICPPIDASYFIKDGMIRDVDIVTESGIKYLKIVFNSDAGERVIKIPVTDLVTEYTVSGGSENYLVIDNFKIGVKVGEGGLATERNIHDLQDIVGAGFDGKTITHKVQDLENAIGSIDITSGLTDVYAKIREVSGKTNTNESNINALSGSVVTLSSGLTSLSGSVSDISEDVRALSGTVSEVDEKVDSVSDDLSGLSQNISSLSGSVTDIDSRLSEIEEGDGGKITEEIRDKDGNLIVPASATTTEAVEAIVEELDKKADEEATAAFINDLDERIREIEEEGSLVRNLIGDEDIKVEGPDASGITHVSLLGISNPEPIVLEMERTIHIVFNGVSGISPITAKTWDSEFTFTTPQTPNDTDKWFIDKNRDGLQSIGEVSAGGMDVTIDLNGLDAEPYILVTLISQE